MFEIQIIIKNRFGEFKGRKVIVDDQNLNKIKESSKLFYQSAGFELTCEDGSFVVFPPEIVRESMLKIDTKKIGKEDV